MTLQVVEHMSERITRLPQGMQLGLKLSACLGSKFDAFTLERGTPENGIDINEFLCFAVEVRATVIIDCFLSQVYYLTFF